MKEEMKEFKILLTLCEITSLYLGLGDTYKTDVDLANSYYNMTALKNSMTILLKLEF